MNTRNIQVSSNKLRDIERYCLSALNEYYPEQEIRQFFCMLVEAYLGWDKVQFLLHREEPINQSDLLKFHWAIEDLKRFRPIQHIVGYADFCDCRISVNEDVLIPRPETEEIVYKTVELLNVKGPHVLDICTGSGCIAIALSRAIGDAEIIGIDVSEQALKQARNNARLNEANVDFRQLDVIRGSLPDEKFDLIVSNPPYIMEKERVDMAKNVLDYEPGLALFVSDEDPLLFYKVISQYAATHLKPHGLLVFEINERFGKETIELLSGLGFDADLSLDFRGKDRMVVAHL